MNLSNRTHLSIVWIWFLFTVSLAIWQLVFVIDLLSHLKTATSLPQEQLQRQMRMVTWEMATLILSLVSGGVYLLLLIQKEKRQVQKIKEFFATFTHELKTKLATVILQADSLLEKQVPPDQEKIIKRLSSEISKLETQLENSLFLAQRESQKFYLETVSLSKIVNLIQSSDLLQVKLSQDGEIQGDLRALESIFKNIAQNAKVHGKATVLSIEVKPSSRRGFLVLAFKDNGQGFQGELPKKIRPFSRLYSRSGNGLGLYLVKELVEAMAGSVDFSVSQAEFTITLELQGRLL